MGISHACMIEMKCIIKLYKFLTIYKDVEDIISEPAEVWNVVILSV